MTQILAKQAKLIESSQWLCYDDSTISIVLIIIIIISKMNLEILTVLIVLSGSWTQSSLAATSVTSASEVIL